MQPEAKCPACGAALEGKVAQSGLLTCTFCGAGVDLGGKPNTRLISAADFSGPEVNGWRLMKHPGQTQNGSWTVTQSNDGQNHALLHAPGKFDDFDVTLVFQLLASSPADGLFLRGRGADAGAMTAHVWRSGAVSLGWQQPDHNWQQPLVSLETPVDPQQPHRLRWIAQGPRHQLYLDGQLLISANHRHILHAGYLDVRMQVTGPEATLEIRELSVSTP